MLKRFRGITSVGFSLLASVGLAQSALAVPGLIGECGAPIKVGQSGDNYGWQRWLSRKPSGEILILAAVFKEVTWYPSKFDIRGISAGTDGEFGTSDDVERTITEDVHDVVGFTREAIIYTAESGVGPPLVKLQLKRVGPDGEFGTSDDVTVTLIEGGWVGEIDFQAFKIRDNLVAVEFNDELVACDLEVESGQGSCTPSGVLRHPSRPTGADFALLPFVLKEGNVRIPYLLARVSRGSPSQVLNLRTGVWSEFKSPYDPNGDGRVYAKMPGTNELVLRNGLSLKVKRVRNKKDNTKEGFRFSKPKRFNRLGRQQIVLAHGTQGSRKRSRPPMIIRVPNTIPGKPYFWTDYLYNSTTRQAYELPRQVAGQSDDPWSAVEGQYAMPATNTGTIIYLIRCGQ